MSVFYLDPRHTRSLTHSLEAHSVTKSFLEEVSTDNFDRAPSVNFRLQFYSYTEFFFFCYFLSRLSPFPFIYSFFIWTTATLIIVFVLFSGSEVSDEKIRKNKRNTLISVVVLWCSITDVSVVSYLLLPPLCPFTVPHTLFLFENGITNRFRTP